MQKFHTHTRYRYTHTHTHTHMLAECRTCSVTHIFVYIYYNRLPILLLCYLLWCDFYNSPELTWRDIQYLIAYTSNRDNLNPNKVWVTNGAGLKVSRRFGFGAIDAEAIVTRARRWINVPEQHLYNFTPTVPTANR